MKRLRLPLLAVAVALLASFSSKPKEWTLLQCYHSPVERDQQMLQAVTAMIFGGYEVTDYLAVERNGLYCYEISFLDPVRP